VFSTEKNVRSKYLNGITSAKVAGQIMDNALRVADSSSCRPSDPGKVRLPTAQPTTSKKCKSPVTKNSAVNAVVENTLPENLKGAAIGRAESVPSPSLEITLGKQQPLNGYMTQELKDKDNFNHSNSSAFSRYLLFVVFKF
jgi:pseudo-response regulator 5